MQTSEPERIIIADDHPLFRDALRGALSAQFPAADITEAGAIDAVEALLGDGVSADLLLLDLAMPGVKGFSGLLSIRAQHPSVPVVVVSANEEPAIIRRCIDFGAAGFIPKSLDVSEMRDAVAAVLGGEIWVPQEVDLDVEGEDEQVELAARLATLTPQQLRVLMMLSAGLLNKQIAYELSVSEATVKAHVSAILQKLGVDSRLQAVILASKIDQTEIAVQQTDE
ncbi:MAG: response regulator transcription factor [Pseudomonadota bacterium]